MPLPRPQRTPARDRWSSRPETPAGKSQPKPLPRPARENSGSLSCTKACSNPAWKPAAPRPLPATSRCRRLRRRTSACRELKTKQASWLRPKVWPCENTVYSACVPVVPRQFPDSFKSMMEPLAAMLAARACQLIPGPNSQCRSLQVRNVNKDPAPCVAA